MTDFFSDAKNIENKFLFNFDLQKYNNIFDDKAEEDWFPIFYEILPKFEINTYKRVAGFFAQTAHESDDFNILEENLKYSARGLRNTFPRKFPTLKKATEYQNNPEKIANYVYSGLGGNGNPSTGDGWKYRGRGIIQITTKSNYKECSRFLFNDDRLLDDPDLLLKDKTICVLSACWYWESRNINSYCDKLDVIGMTKSINGGTNGLLNRRSRFVKYLNLLQK